MIGEPGEPPKRSEVYTSVIERSGFEYLISASQSLWSWLSVECPLPYYHNSGASIAKDSLLDLLRKHWIEGFKYLTAMASVNQMGEGTLPSVSELFSLQGKTAICTGGTGGLGLSMAIALAEAGADIVSIQIKNDPRASLLEEGVKACGRKLSVFEANVADCAGLRACFAKIWESGVVPDILLNCAGINRRAKVEDFTDEDIDAVIIPPGVALDPDLCPEEKQTR